MFLINHLKITKYVEYNRSNDGDAEQFCDILSPEYKTLLK